MLQTIILVLFNIAATYFTVDNIKKTSSRSSILNIKTFLITLYAIGVALPLLEESLFRGVCKQYLSGVTCKCSFFALVSNPYSCFTCVPFSNYINGLIFGLAHAHNYFLHRSTFITIIQMISTAYLGYYLVQFDSFLYAYLVHCLYNISITTMSYAIIYFMNDWSAIQPDSSIVCCRPEILDDMRKPKTDYSYIFIDRKKIPADMLERIDNFEKIHRRHLGNTRRL